jgi:hypothetical protein
MLTDIFVTFSDIIKEEAVILVQTGNQPLI